jgi:type II secretory pathway pseudopilin PulG
MLSFLKDSKGLTLVEVIVSIIMVGIIAIAMIVTVAQSSIYSRRLDLIYDSAYLAQRRIELLKKFDFDQLYPGAAETDVRIGLDGTADASGDYVRTTSVYTTTSDHLIRVKVSVDKYVDGAPSGNAVVMETLLSDIE